PSLHTLSLHDALPISHLHELIQLEHQYWWHVAKRQLVFSWIRTCQQPPARIIEGGIGGGTNLLELKNLGYEVTGLDILPESISRSEEHTSELQSRENL